MFERERIPYSAGMLAELVFVTRLLGLMSGPRMVQMQVDPAVHRVELVLDGKNVAALTQPPWRATIDFGLELAPHDLTAIARDAEGREIGRDTQFVNLARPRAELGVMFRREGDGRLSAIVQWEHIAQARPRRISAALDGRPLRARVGAPIALPPIAPAVHVLAVEVEFADQVMAHREVVFGGIFTEQLPAELTATLVHQRERGRADLTDCFRVNGRAVAASAVEPADAAVIFVRSSSPAFAASQLWRRDPRRGRLPEATFAVPKSSLRFVWPSIETVGDSTLFANSRPVKGDRGVRFFLTRLAGPTTDTYRFIDALTVAGVEALHESRRRAVVLVLGKDKDQSQYTAATVRHYFERIGVPLFVWSLNGTNAELEQQWGRVYEISTEDRLRVAVDDLRRELDRQRVAWLPLNPMDALRVETTGDCIWSAVGKPPL